LIHSIYINIFIFVSICFNKLSQISQKRWLSHGLATATLAGSVEHLSVTLNPVLLWGYLGEVPPLPHEGAWASQFPANSLRSQAFGNYGTELTCSVPSSFFLSTSA